MIFKQVLTPDKNNHSIEMPEQFYGKTVEVIVVELDDRNNDYPVPPGGKEIIVNELFENFGDSPDFPSVEDIRTKGWPSKW